MSERTVIDTVPEHCCDAIDALIKKFGARPARVLPTADIDDADCEAALHAAAALAKRGGFPVAGPLSGESDSVIKRKKRRRARKQQSE